MTKNTTSRKVLISHLNLLKSGFAGFLEGSKEFNSVVDRREFPTAIPLAENKRFGIPAYTKIDNIIPLDSPLAIEFGFTSEKFLSDSYLWRSEDRITISNITARTPGQGDFAELCKRIEQKGFYIAVPTPFRRMQEILIKQNYKFYVDNEGCEIWIKPK